MKSKTTALLGLTIALSLPMAGLFSSIATAQNSASPPSQGQPYQGRGQGRQGKWAAELNLTADQQARIQQIQQTTKQQMEAVLTPEQKAQIEASRQRGERPRQLKGSLNLTEEQKNQMRQIRESSRQQMEAVLTPEQRQKLEQLRQQRQNNRQQRGQGRVDR